MLVPGVQPLLCLRRERRNPSVGWIGNLGRTPARQQAAGLVGIEIASDVQLKCRIDATGGGGPVQLIPLLVSRASSSVREAFPANSLGRSSGVAVSFSHMPCKSGRPSGVRIRL